ncbi:hypothetical protein ACLHDG_08275 [Sulfurovum sp. CS9]|uniref:hypothetical protein n=1 Tax=Sulfurovum sp. CS9 TaxID=3391146 RepID=UPI0039E734E6
MTMTSQDYETVANFKLIEQVATYYSSTQQDIQTYRDMNTPVLESLSIKHLMHWKQELHALIFNGLNCRERLL